ncbi:MAG: FRG domain-containing protein [Pseudomonadota bacterium]
MDFAGQWIGKSIDGVSRAIVDLDEHPEGFLGTGRLFFTDGRPGATIAIGLHGFEESYNFEAAIEWLPLSEPSPVSSHRVSQLYPEYDFPDKADIQLTHVGDELVLKWSTDAGALGELVLARADMSGPSELAAREMSWDQFKEFALSNTPGSMIFRGQPAPYRLRTAFHRTYRKDLVRYARVDIPSAHRLLTARTDHFFNLESAKEIGAFYNLLQHHGYPTPLLDWTLSPFVAAFFAYRKRQTESEKGKKVRIFAFDREKWVNQFNQVIWINFVDAHFSILEALAIENPRAIPQQAISTVTNVDDIEGYISARETEQGEKYLHAIDLDPNDRPTVMSELSLMGITAGSLFPGLDGACEELVGRLFHHQVPAKKRAFGSKLDTAEN